jgi:hypothetical protein
MDSSASVGLSITRLGISLKDLGGSIDSLQVHKECMTETTKAITTHLDHQESVLDQLTTAMEAHLEQLNNLMELEKARHKQTSNHWKRLEDIKLVIKQMEENITTTNKAIEATICQNDQLTAQLTGVWANAKTVANNARSDIMDLRACLTPELCDALSSLFTEVKSLQDTLSVLGTTLKDCLKSTTLPMENVKTPVVEQDIPPSPTNPPFRPMTLPTNENLPTPIKLTHRFDSSWYHNTIKWQQDDLAGSPLQQEDTGSQCLDSSVPNPTRTLQIDTSVDKSNPPLLGGHITLPCSTDKE